MRVGCNDKDRVFKTSEASTKSWFRTNGLIDKYLNILDLNNFRKQNTKWSNYARIKYGTEGRLFSEGHDGTRAIPNKQAFKQIDRAKGIYYQTETSSFPNDEAITAIKNKMKKFFASIGVVYNPTTEILDREGNPVSAIAAADILKRTVSVIEGKMSADTLPEEAAHFLIEMLPSDNSLYQVLRKNIENTEIYQKTLEDYYTTYAGDLEKIAKEAMGKVIAQAIVNKVTKQEIPADIKPKMNLINRIINWITNKVVRNPNAINEIDDMIQEYNKAVETLSETILSPDNFVAKKNTIPNTPTTLIQPGITTQIETTDRLREQIINKIAAVKPAEITLTYYNLNLEKGTILLSGHAANRNVLVSFKEAVEKTDGFTDVALPITSYINEQDFDFDMNVVYKSLAPKEAPKLAI